MQVILSEKDRAEISQKMLRNSALSCFETMDIINSNDDVSKWHLPFYLLASTGMELFAKFILMKRKILEGKSLLEIERSLRFFSHDLSKLYSEEGLGREFMSRVGILNVIKIADKNKLNFSYDFYITGEKSEILHIYDQESIKYGLMSDNKPNSGIVAYQFDEVLKLCKNIASNANLFHS